MLDEFDQAFDQLVEMPGLGHRRQDLTKRNVLFWPIRNYLVIYQKKVPLLSSRSFMASVTPERFLESAEDRLELPRPVRL